jgi:hypothetical protein
MSSLALLQFFPSQGLSPMKRRRHTGERELWIILSWFLEKRDVGHTGIEWFNLRRKRRQNGDVCEYCGVLFSTIKAKKF